MKEIEDFNIEKWVQRKKTHNEFRQRVEKLTLKVRKEFKSENIDTWGDDIRNEVLNISTFIMRYPEGTTEMAVNEVFSNEKIDNVFKKIEKQADEASKKKGFYMKEEELKKNNEDKSEDSDKDNDNDSDEEMEGNDEFHKYIQQENGESLSLS
jgi:hypothetical protein